MYSVYGRNSPNIKDISIRQQHWSVRKFHQYREKYLLKFNEQQTIALLFLKNKVGNWGNTYFPSRHVKIVISSSWREIFDIDTIKSVFSADIADKIEGVTPIHTKPTKFFRHSEVMEYMSKNDLSNESWVAINDIAEHYPDNISIVVTNPYVGFDEKAAIELGKLLNNKY